MRRLVLIVSVATALGVATPASAQGVSLSPRSGDVNTTFVFKGRGWQPRQRVEVRYFVSTSAARPYKSFHFLAGTRGSFVFKFTKPIGLVDGGVTSRLCFRQRDTRRETPRTLRACTSFYVAPPVAQFMPTTAMPGELFLLLVSRFLPGRRLEGTLTLPGGATRTFAVRTRRQGAFVGGGPFGPIFVPRGGGVVPFPSQVTDAFGTYTALVVDPRAGSRARAVFVLAQ